MDTNLQTDAYYRNLDEIAVERKERRRREAEVDELMEPHLPVRIRLFGTPIHLSLPEFQIIRFLSAKPYKAFTPEQIIQGIERSEYDLSEDNLSTHVRSLRAKLGMFADFVQTVPYIGYRFKP